MKTPSAVALCALVFLGFVSPIFAGGPIFPTPIHITREVQDPISGKTIVLNEYGYGNRLVAVRDHVTAIADYEKGELIEIDRNAGTYSVTRFETIAKAAKLQGGGEGGEIPAAQGASQTVRGDVKALGAKATKSGRPADFFRVEGESQAVEVAIDRNVSLSREALEVLLGTAYPGTGSRQHDAVIAAAAHRGGGRGVAADAASQEPSYSLPLEQRFEIGDGEETIEFRSSVLRVGNEPPPADMVAIPAGARLVESRTAGVLRELERIDSPPLQPSPRP